MISPEKEWPAPGPWKKPFSWRPRWPNRKGKSKIRNLREIFAREVR
jgi:hypothetical protein